jgi:hypothetical protein
LADNVAAEYLGGKLSDNQWGIVIRASDRVTLQDFDIVGSSKIFKDHTESRSLKLCSWPDWRHQGIMMPSFIWQTGSQDPGLGLRLRNVNISGYDMEKQWYFNCKSTEVRPAFETNIHHFPPHANISTTFLDIFHHSLFPLVQI